MRMDWLITFRSVTFAQSGERALKRIGVECVLRRTPRELSNRGCGYCLYVRGKDAVAAAAVLREQEIPFGRIYAMGVRGEMEERVL